MAYILIVVLVAGLLMYLLTGDKAQEIGRMMLFAAILALLIALAPATVRMFH
jgi:riboflavin transporter FmnP